MNDNLRRVLVTGSSRGIGKAIALSLARDNFNVVINCRSNADLAKDVVEEIEGTRGQASFLQFDIVDREMTSKTIEQDIAANGPYYGVVCNAGITRDNAFPAISGEDWDAVLHTNLDGFYNVTNPLIMPMIRARKGGRIVVMSSVSGITGNRGQVNYSASKAGLIGATKALAIELAKRKITVNCVAPGLIDTEMVSQEVLDEALKMIPAGRMGNADEVASLVSYLFSDLAAYVTRQVISINGGMI